MSCRPHWRAVLVGRGAFALLALAALLAPPGAASDLGDVKVSFVGVRTEEAYHPLEPFTSGCSACADPVPANEWLWLRVEAPFSPAEVRVSYREGACICRHLDLLVYSGVSVLVPAATENVSQINVIVGEGPGPGGTPTRRATFPVLGAMPKDPREVALHPTEEWVHTRVRTTGAGLATLDRFMSSPASETARASSLLLDMRVTPLPKVPPLTAAKTVVAVLSSCAVLRSAPACSVLAPLLTRSPVVEMSPRLSAPRARISTCGGPASEKMRIASEGCEAPVCP